MNIQNINFKTLLGLISLFFLFSSCEEEALPKPTGFLRLEHPSVNYRTTKTPQYEFEVPKNAKIFVNSKSWMKIKYPKLKAVVDITYRPVNNNIKELLKEADKLTTKHLVKADAIFYDTYENKLEKVYGKLNTVTGNAASPIQFHLTDSTKHFLTGAVYFNIQPNYDSIYPSIKQIEKDLMRLIGTTKWKTSF